MALGLIVKITLIATAARARAHFLPGHSTPLQYKSDNVRINSRFGEVDNLGKDISTGLIDILEIDISVHTLFFPKTIILNSLFVKHIYQFYMGIPHCFMLWLGHSRSIWSWIRPRKNPESLELDAKTKGHVLNTFSLLLQNPNQSWARHYHIGTQSKKKL